jgi:hypothetical protein
MTAKLEAPAGAETGEREKTAQTTTKAPTISTTNNNEIEGDALSLAFPSNEERFCGWRNDYAGVNKGGERRKTKVPYCALGKKAKSNDPSTWILREDAEHLANDPSFRAGAADGVCGVGVFLGLIPSPDGNMAFLSSEGDKLFIGIDADTCRDPETGAFTRPWAEKLVATFQSYAEVSPSQTGFKIFAFVPASRPNKEYIAALLQGKAGKQWKEDGQDHPAGIELYTDGRFFTFTGDRLPQSPKTIELVTTDALRVLFEVIGPSVNPPRKQNTTGTQAEAGNKKKSSRANGRANGRDHTPGGERQNAEADDAYWHDAPDALRDLKTPQALALLIGDVSHLKDKSASTVAFHLALQCQRADMLEPETRDTLARYPHKDLSKYCGKDADAERQWQRIWEKTTPLPELEVRGHNLPETADEVIETLCANDGLYLRDQRPIVLSLGREGANDTPKAERLTMHGVVRLTHECRRVWQWKSTPDGGFVQKPVTLPERVANLALDHRNAWRGLPLLEGITSAPLLSDDGTIRTANGYDRATGFFCFSAPVVSVPERPTRAQAEASFRRLRGHLRTFAFADAARVRELNADVVDISKPPGADESAALYALLTAICRPSLWLGPGFLCTAASVTGAGAGKGLLVRVIVAIAMGMRPSAVSPGHSQEEMDKRLVSALIDARPVVFIDNINGATLKSDTLASALTERPANLRVLGKSETVSVTAAAFIAITGNGLTVSEDLARRFVACALDGGEDAEARDFKGFPNPVDQSFAQRGELLSDALTIWRWGRQNPQKTGKPIGSFEQWAQWVRDPLLALGCTDPADRIAEAKSKDPQRMFIAELFTAWDKAHGDKPVPVSALDAMVAQLLNPGGKMPRQWVAKRVSGLEGTRAIGLILKTVPKTGRHTSAKYCLTRETHEGIGVIGGMGGGGGAMTPVTPMPYDPLGPNSEGEL